MLDMQRRIARHSFYQHAVHCKRWCSSSTSLVTSSNLPAVPVSPLTVVRHAGRVSWDEPKECSIHSFADPVLVDRIVCSLAGGNLNLVDTCNLAKHVIGGLGQAPLQEQRDLAARLTAALQEEGVSKINALNEVIGDARFLDIWHLDSARDLVARMPISVGALVTAFGGHGSEMLSHVKPLDVLSVPQHRPQGMSHPGHAFCNLLQWRKGPLYRNQYYVRSLKVEREHFAWVAEQIRSTAPTFFKQYVDAQLKAGVTHGRLDHSANGFLVFVTEKLYALAAVDQLPELLRRQAALDTAGCPSRRNQFVQEFRFIPPPLAAVAEAFGVDARQRRPIDAERPVLAWQRDNLWPRKKTYKLTERLFPSAEEMGLLALKSPLRHRPFASLLASLSEEEDALLRAWYPSTHAGEPVLHVLWSRELVQAISSYLACVLQSFAASSTARTRGRISILCLGSGASRLRHYLNHILGRNFQDGLRVAAAVPSQISTLNGDDCPVHWLTSSDSSANALPVPAEGRLTLKELLEQFCPQLVICACMPPKTDWTDLFRFCPTVQEYLLVGPQDCSRSGDLHLTWGGSEPFIPPKGECSYAKHGFVRQDLEHLSRYCLGTDDAPGFIGANSVVSFRRIRGGQARLSFAASPSELPSSISGLVSEHRVPY